MPRFTKADAQRIAALIAQNSADFGAHKLTYEEFSAKNRAYWREADRDELRIMGSDCDRRVTAVHEALRAIR